MPSKKFNMIKLGISKNFTNSTKQVNILAIWLIHETITLTKFYKESKEPFIDYVDRFWGFIDDPPTFDW